VSLFFKLRSGHSSFGNAVILSMTFKDMALRSTALLSSCFYLSTNQNILMSEKILIMDITVTNSPTVCLAKPIRLAPNVFTQ